MVKTLLLPKMEKFWELYSTKKSDMLIFGLQDIFNAAVKITPTKRNILSAIASAYDPIGYIQSIVIKLKFLF